MLVIFQCDNANHVEVAHRVVHSPRWPTSCRAEILVLDWAGDTRRWVTTQIARLGWDVAWRDVVQRAPNLLQADLLKAKTPPERQDFLVVATFEALKVHLGSDDVVLVQFNDASIRGRAVATACRQMGIARLLVQDGFLTFRSKTGDLAAADQNYRWGSTKPEHVAVWGPAMLRQLQERHRVPPGAVRVTGPVKDLAGKRLPRAAREAGAVPRVLWADQPMTDQGKAPAEVWLAEFAEVGRALARYDTTLKLHPSTTEGTRTELLASLPPGLRLDAEGAPLRAGELAGYDCLVTYYSTVFLDALAAGIPTVIVRTRSVDIELPEIDDPLLVYCADAAGLEDAIARAMAARSPEGWSDALLDHVTTDNGFDGVAEMIADLVAGVPQQEEARAPWTGFAYPEAVALRRLQGRRVLVLGTSFGRHIGVGKPVISLLRELEGSGIDFDFHVATGRTGSFLLARAETASLVLINSLDVVKTLTRDTMQRLLDRCEAAGTPILFYAHETEHVFDRRRRELPERFSLFLNDVLPRVSCLAVSDRQAEWLASLGARRIRVVYNSIGRSEPIARGEREGTPRIVMVGTRQARKGVELFSRVADLAAQSGLDWRFEWLGSETTESDYLYHSPRVHWRGQVSETGVRETLQGTSCFFLSSIDDPMPLSVGEALAAGVPSLVYRKTGFSDFIAHSGAGDVFDFYEPHHVLTKLRDLLEGRRRASVVPEQVLALVGASAFARRCVVALGEEILASHHRQVLFGGGQPAGASVSAAARAVRPWLSPAYVLRRTKVTSAAKAVLPTSLAKPVWRLGKRLRIL